MSSGKSKKKSKTAASGSGFPVIPILAGIIVVAGLIWGGSFLMQQRGSTKEYDTSVTKVKEQLNRDPDTAQGQLKLSEVSALVSGNPTVTRETEGGVDYAVYEWGTGRKLGFRLKLEKNGPHDEVIEIATFGAQP